MGNLSQEKAAAIMGFVDMMIGAFDAGFVDKNNPTLSEIHQVARNHIKDTYGIEVDDIVKRWGSETTEACRVSHGDLLKQLHELIRQLAKKLNNRADKTHLSDTAIYRVCAKMVEELLIND